MSVSRRSIEEAVSATMEGNCSVGPEYEAEALVREGIERWVAANVDVIHARTETSDMQMATVYSSDHLLFLQARYRTRLILDELTDGWFTNVEDRNSSTGARIDTTALMVVKP